MMGLRPKGNNVCIQKAHLHSKGDRVVVVVDHRNFQPQLQQCLVYICFVWILVVVDVVDGGVIFLNRNPSCKFKTKLKWLLSLLTIDSSVKVIVPSPFFSNPGIKALLWCHMSMNNHPRGGIKLTVWSREIDGDKKWSWWWGWG